MEIEPHSGQIIFIKVLIGWWSPRKLFFHDGNQLTADFIQLISGEQVGNLQTNCFTIYYDSSSKVNKIFFVFYSYTLSETCK